MEAKSDLEKLMMNIKQSCDAALKDYINQQKVMYEKKVRGHLTRSLSCTTLCDKIVTDLWQVGSQALDVWTPLFPVDPPFSTKLNFTKFNFFPLNTCIKHICV